MIRRPLPLLLAWASLALLPAGAQESEKDRLRRAIGDGGLADGWVYDDLEAGIASARATGKPLMVLLRCVP